METYRPRSIKRKRSTKKELSDLDDVIVAVVGEEYPVTLRGVFYRVVSRGAVEKTEGGYKRVMRRLLDLRREGRVPWHCITDGTRWVIEPRTYDDAEDALAATASLYRADLWRQQPVAVQIFTEKDAISGVISGTTRQYGVPFGITRGYGSETFAHTVAMSIEQQDKPMYVYQLGDHDPSGVDAWRDFQRKVTGFIPDAEVYFDRLAVTPEQIEHLDLPTRPTKVSDSRAGGFLGESVEVDAIPANTLRQIVTDAIEAHIDQHALSVAQMVERSERELLWSMVEDVEDYRQAQEEGHERADTPAEAEEH